jgi:hypothetical protein
MDMFKVKRIASLGRRYLVGARTLDVEFNIRYLSHIVLDTHYIHLNICFSHMKYDSDIIFMASGLGCERFT